MYRSSGQDGKRTNGDTSRPYNRQTIRFVERNGAFDIAARIQNLNLTQAKACAILSIIDCLASA